MPTMTADSIRNLLNQVIRDLHPLSGARELSQLDRMELAMKLQTALQQVEAVNIATAFERDWTRENKVAV